MNISRKEFKDASQPNLIIEGEMFNLKNNNGVRLHTTDFKMYSAFDEFVDMSNNKGSHMLLTRYTDWGDIFAQSSSDLDFGKDHNDRAIESIVYSDFEVLDGKYITSTLVANGDIGEDVLELSITNDQRISTTFIVTKLRNQNFVVSTKFGDIEYNLIYDASQDLIILVDRDGTYYDTADDEWLGSSSGSVMNLFKVITNDISGITFQDNVNVLLSPIVDGIFSFNNIKLVSNIDKNIKTVQGTTSNTYDLNGDIRDIKYNKSNFFLHYQPKSIDENNNLVINATHLDNHLTLSGSSRDESSFVGEKVHNHRRYSSISSGNNSITGNYSISSAFSVYAQEISTGNGAVTFTTPDDLYPYDKIDINDSLFVSCGAIAGETPLDSDRFEYNTKVDGQSFFAWLYEDPEQGPMWYDRYMLNGLYFEGVFNPATNNDITDLAGNVNIADGSTYVDVKSRMVIEPSNSYTYYHLNNEHVGSIVSARDYKDVIGDVSVRFDGKQNDMYYPSQANVFTCCFSYTPESRHDIGHNIIGNIGSSGFALINDEDVTPFIITVNDNKISLLNHDGVVIRYNNLDSNILCIIPMSSFNDGYVVITSDSIYKLNDDVSIQYTRLHGIDIFEGSGDETGITYNNVDGDDLTLVAAISSTEWLEFNISINSLEVSNMIPHNTPFVESTKGFNIKTKKSLVINDVRYDLDRDNIFNIKNSLECIYIATIDDINKESDPLVDMCQSYDNHIIALSPSNIVIINADKLVEDIIPMDLGSMYRIRRAHTYIDNKKLKQYHIYHLDGNQTKITITDHNFNIINTVEVDMNDYNVRCDVIYPSFLLYQDQYSAADKLKFMLKGNNTYGGNTVKMTIDIPLADIYNINNHFCVVNDTISGIFRVMMNGSVYRTIKYTNSQFSNDIILNGIGVGSSFFADGTSINTYSTDYNTLNNIAGKISHLKLYEEILTTHKCRLEYFNTITLHPIDIAIQCNTKPAMETIECINALDVDSHLSNDISISLNNLVVDDEDKGDIIDGVRDVLREVVPATTHIKDIDINK